MKRPSDLNGSLASWAIITFKDVTSAALCHIFFKGIRFADISLNIVCSSNDINIDKAKETEDGLIRQWLKEEQEIKKKYINIRKENEEQEKIRKEKAKDQFKAYLEYDDDKSNDLYYINRSLWLEERKRLNEEVDKRIGQIRRL